MRAIRWTGNETIWEVEEALGVMLVSPMIRANGDAIELVIHGGRWCVRPGEWLAYVDGGPIVLSPGYDWSRITDASLIQLALAAEEMSGYVSSPEMSTGRVTADAYIDLANAATRLRLIRHGNDRISEGRKGS